MCSHVRKPAKWDWMIESVNTWDSKQPCSRQVMGEPFKILNMLAGALFETTSFEHENPLTNLQNPHVGSQIKSLNYVFQT